jgi:hypothetical protein
MCSQNAELTAEVERLTAQMSRYDRLGRRTTLQRASSTAPANASDFPSTINRYAPPCAAVVCGADAARAGP